MFLEEIGSFKPNSNKFVEASCDICYEPFARQFQLLNKQTVHRCKDCNRKHVAAKNSETQGGKPRVFQRGQQHPRWRSDKSEFVAYQRKVRWLSEVTYRQYKHEINPCNLPRTRCGEGGYQLDHIVSIYEGFKKNLDPVVLSNRNNLQMLPWKDNRTKGI